MHILKKINILLKNGILKNILLYKVELNKNPHMYRVSPRFCEHYTRDTFELDLIKLICFKLVN